MQFVEHDAAQIGEERRGVAMRDQQCELLGRGKQYVRRPLDLAGALGRRGIAGAGLDFHAEPHFPDWRLEIAGDVDFILVMSVNPGFGGQKFIPKSLQKVAGIREMLDRAGNNTAPIEIDGGIDVTNVARAVEAGVEIVVAGSAIFNAPDPTAATKALKDAAAAVAS